MLRRRRLKGRAPARVRARCEVGRLAVRVEGASTEIIADIGLMLGVFARREVDAEASTREEPRFSCLLPIDSFWDLPSILRR